MSPYLFKNIRKSIKNDRKTLFLSSSHLFGFNIFNLYLCVLSLGGLLLAHISSPQEAYSQRQVIPEWEEREHQAKRAQREERRHRGQFVGMWRGTYECEGVSHPLVLKILERKEKLKVIFSAFYNSETPLQFVLDGIVKRKKGRLYTSLTPRRWVERPSSNFRMVKMKGALNQDRLSGQVVFSSCGEFSVTRLSCGVGKKAVDCSPRTLGEFWSMLNRSKHKYVNQAHIKDDQDMLYKDSSPSSNSKTLKKLKKLKKELKELKKELKELKKLKTLKTLKTPKLTSPKTSPQKKTPTLISEEDLNILLQSIEDTDFEKDKLKVLRSGLYAKPHFTPFQVKTILELWSFDNERIKALEVLVPRLSTRMNQQVIIESFSFQPSKNKALKLLE